MKTDSGLYAIIKRNARPDGSVRHIYDYDILGEPIIDIVTNAVRDAGVTVLKDAGGISLNDIECLLFIDACLPNITADAVSGLIDFHFDAESRYTAVSTGTAYLVAKEHVSCTGGVFNTDAEFIKANPLYYDNGSMYFDRAASLKDVMLSQNAIMKRTNAKLLSQGVYIINPEMTYISPKAVIGQGTVIYPNTFIEGKTVIGQNCVIRQNCRLSGMTVGDGVVIDNSVLLSSTVGNHTTIGPFAYVRPGSVIGDHVKIGDFVEVKNSTIGNNTKASHLTYLGDSDIGNNINIGCGVVTVNYNGVKKARATIKDGAFIGCNVNLISPVTVEENAYVAAGSTINRDVPENSLGIARARQENKPNFKLRH